MYFVNATAAHGMRTVIGNTQGICSVGHFQQSNSDGHGGGAHQTGLIPLVPVEQQLC